jgi:hypothetical protein
MIFEDQFFGKRREDMSLNYNFNSRKKTSRSQHYPNPQPAIIHAATSVPPSSLRTFAEKEPSLDSSAAGS